MTSPDGALRSLTRQRSHEGSTTSGRARTSTRRREKRRDARRDRGTAIARWDVTEGGNLRAQHPQRGGSRSGTASEIAPRRAVCDPRVRVRPAGTRRFSRRERVMIRGVAEAARAFGSTHHATLAVRRVSFSLPIAFATAGHCSTRGNDPIPGFSRIRRGQPRRAVTVRTHLRSKVARPGAYARRINDCRVLDTIRRTVLRHCPRSRAPDRRPRDVHRQRDAFGNSLAADFLARSDC